MNLQREYSTNGIERRGQTRHASCKRVPREKFPFRRFKAGHVFGPFRSSAFRTAGTDPLANPSEWQVKEAGIVRGKRAPRLINAIRGDDRVPGRELIAERTISSSSGASREFPHELRRDDEPSAAKRMLN